MNTINDRALRVTAAAVFAFALASFGATSPAAAKALVKTRQALTATAAAPGASGEARFELHNADDGRLRIFVRGLAPDASFDVVVGGIKVGTIETNKAGNGRIRFRSRPRGHDRVLGFDPRGATLSIRAANGDDVLTGTIADGGTPDPGDVVCCIPDDSGAECEDRTADECAAQGGTVSDATSCLPNPCAGAPAPGVDIVCCIPDDSGPECEDRTGDQCAAQGGTVVDATDCSANPCAATTPTPTPTPGSGNDDPPGDDHGGHGNEPGDDNGGHGAHGGHGHDD